MPRYVALLGGINVGGHRVTMDRLRTEFAELGHTEIATFIASGNVVFTAAAAPDTALADRIAEHLGRQLGWPVPAYVRTAEEVLATTDLRPFGPTPADCSHMVAFCRSSPDQAIEARSTPVDRFQAHGREVHWLIAGKLLDSAFTLPQLTKALGQPCTTRNITSLQRLCELLR
ncbi:MAG: DUF1697 domain-containing protein [Actinomycetota bacterium]|nr:DUF1697 domain-containing protein [Actinomycetota bacterium]